MIISVRKQLEKFINVQDRTHITLQNIQVAFRCKANKKYGHAP